MKTIVFRNVIPQVFSLRANLVSEVWKAEVTFEKEKTYLIEAESGKGKSTFCSYVTGYRDDYSGSILFDSTDTRSLKVKDWVAVRKKHVSQLFQELRLFPELSAYENVEIKNKLTGFKSKNEIRAWFERLGIAEKWDAKIGRMSFGQQQRVALIRALVQPFDFLLADEPISHLDDANAHVMGEILMEEVRAQGAGLIITSIGKHMDLAYDHIIQL